MAMNLRDRKPRRRPVDPRLSKIGPDWFWDGLRLPYPIPENSEAAFAIAVAMSQAKPSDLFEGHRDTSGAPRRGTGKGAEE